MSAMKLQSGHEVVSLEEKEMKKLKEDFEGYGRDVIRLTPGRWLFPRKYLEFANRIYNFELRKSDVVVMTYPKCGTTWTQEIIWTLLNNPRLNHPWAPKSPLARSPFLDFDMVMAAPKLDSTSPKHPIFEEFLEMCPGKNPDDGINLQLAEAIPDPRTLKTHLPFSLMPQLMLDTAKVVYVVRNPKDVIISFHHHCRIADSLGYVGSFEDFIQYFVNDDLLYGPYWLHLKEAWEKRNHLNLHIIFYEDLKANPLQEIKRLNAFLDTNLTETQLEDIVKYTSFSEMKAREEKLKKEMSKDVVIEVEVSEKKRLKLQYIEKEGSFFRKGQVGDWKNKLTPELDAKVNQWIRSHVTNLGVNFRYGM